MTADHEQIEAFRREAAWRELDNQQIRLIESMMTLMVQQNQVGSQTSNTSRTTKQKLSVSDGDEQLSSINDSILLKTDTD